MMKSALAILIVCGTVSGASAIPMAKPTMSDSLPVTKAAVVVKKTVIRRRHAPVVRHRTVIKKTVVR